MRQHWAVLVVELLAMWAANTAAISESKAEDPPQDVTQRIDALLAEAWQARGLTSTPASDSEFVRRAYLDLTGCAPLISETEQFLASTAPDRRAQLVDELLQRPTHSEYLASRWAGILTPASGGLAESIMNAAFCDRLYADFQDDLGFDTIVANLLTATSKLDSEATYFYMAGPATPAALTTRVTSSLLGIQLECAECHDHPFSHWRREDFWGLAAFFSDLRWREVLNSGEVLASYLEDFDGPDLLLPGTNQVVLPRFLDGRPATAKEGQTRRQVLAAWFVSAENPYFARSTVNRVWAMLFGEPLVGSLDDVKVAAGDVRIQILEELTAHFIANRFSMRELIRVAANTRAYRATSKTQDDGAGDELFNRMPIKPLTIEQWHASLENVIKSPYDRSTPVGLGVPLDLKKMAAMERMPSESAESGYHGEVEALKMLNGERVASLTDWQRNPLLKSLLEADLQDEQRVAYTFLATVARAPTPAESTRCVAHLQETRTTANRGRALADILWALLNTAEFALNH